MKKLGLLLVLLCFVAFSYAAELKVGIVDLQKVLQASAQVKTADANFKKDFQPREERLKQAGQQLQNQLADFKKNSPNMNDEQKQATEEKINKARANLDAMQAQFQQDVQDAQAKAMQTILNQIQTSINTIAEQGKYDLILPANNVVYYRKTYDITAQVIKAVNNKTV